MNDKTFKIVLIISIIAVIGLSVLFFVLKRQEGQIGNELDSFAQCLTEKNITMYGADTCSACLAQKKYFGKSFEYVSYIECRESPDKCVEAGIERTPTWIFPKTEKNPEGKRLVSKRTLEELSKESGCELPLAEEKTNAPVGDPDIPPFN